MCMKIILRSLHTAPECHSDRNKLRHSASLGKDNTLEEKKCWGVLNIIISEGAYSEKIEDAPLQLFLMTTFHFTSETEQYTT